MALFEDMFKGAGASGLAIGIGAALVAPVLLPALGRVVRPAAKVALKTGMALYRETSAGVGRAASELYHEVQAELTDETTAVGEAASRSTRAHRAER